MRPLLLLLPAFYFYRLMCFDNNEHQSDICHYKSNSVNNLFWQILNFIGNLKCFNLVGFDVKLFCSSKRYHYGYQEANEILWTNGNLSKWYSYFQVEELAIFIIVQCFYCTVVNFLMSSVLLTWCHFVNIVNCRL